MPHESSSEEEARQSIQIVPTDEGMTRASLIIAGIFVALLILGFGLFIVWQRSRPVIAKKLSASEKSIAVLPFENVNADPASAYFAAGVEQEIAERLAQLADLKVISHATTRRFRSAPDDLPEIAQRLGVAHFLEGRVLRQADQLQITVELITAATGEQLWAQTFTRKPDDVFQIESSVATTVAQALQSTNLASHHRGFAPRPTNNLATYDQYLRGRYFMEGSAESDLPQAIQSFQQVIAADKNYAPAFSGLAQSYLRLAAKDDNAWKSSLPQAKTAATQALALDNELAEAQNSLGEVSRELALDLPQALQQFARALELNPNDSSANTERAQTLLAAAQFDPAIAEMQRALVLDPLSVRLRAQFAYVYLIAGRVDDALEQARQTIDLEPTFFWAHSLWGRARKLKGDLPGAVAELKTACQMQSDPQSLAWLADAYTSAGQPADGLQTLQSLQQLVPRHPSAAYFLAAAQAALHQKDQALASLEKSFADPASDLSGLKVEPLFLPLHGDPRFERLAVRIVPVTAK